MSLSGEQQVVQFLCVCMLATQQQISELHVCFIMFWFNYISRCSCVPTKFPLKPIGTIVKLVSRATKKPLGSFWVSAEWVADGRLKYWWNTLVIQMSVWFVRKYNQFQSEVEYSCKNAFWCLTSSNAQGMWICSIACDGCACERFLSVEWESRKIELSSNEFFHEWKFLPLCFECSKKLLNYIIKLNFPSPFAPHANTPIRP